MRKTRALWMVAVSVLSTSAFSGMVAHADTISQTTVQSLYANQTQEVDTQSSDGVSQMEHAELVNASDLSTTTQTGDKSQQSVDQTYVNAQEDHKASGDSQFTQQQSSHAKSTMVRREKPHSLQIHSKTSVETTQTGKVQTNGAATLVQSATSVLTGSQLQSVQGQSVSGPANNVVQTETFTAPPGTTVENPFVTLSQPLDGNTAVVGYAIFNGAGYLMSDRFGGSGTNDKNNGTNHFMSFTPNMPTEVFVAAVNSAGEPVVNTVPVTLYLVSNDSGGWFLDTVTHTVISSVVLPAGVTGMRVDYQNGGSTAAFDVLDATTTNPHPVHVRSYSTQTVLGISQSQSVTLAAPNVTSPPNNSSNDTNTIAPQIKPSQNNAAETSSDKTTNSNVDTTTNPPVSPPVTTATQSQQLVVKADNQQAPAADQQNATITQTGSASQSQKVDVPVPSTSGDESSSSNSQPPTNTISQNEDATITSKLQPSNQSQPSTPNPSVSIDQTESSTTTTDVAMNQTESVTVQAPQITVQLDQIQTPTDTGGITLKQSIAASAPPSDGTNSNTVVNVTINQKSREYVLDTNGPVTITESQTLDTTPGNTQNVAPNTTQGTTQNTMQPADNTPSTETTPPVQDTASLQYQDRSGHKVQISLE